MPACQSERDCHMTITTDNHAVDSLTKTPIACQRARRSFEVSILHAHLAKQQSLAGFAWRRL